MGIKWQDASKVKKNREILARFKVFPEKNGQFFNVRICKSVDSMRRAIGKESASNVVGFCEVYQKLIPPEYKTSLPEIGTIWLNKEHLGIGVVSHEVLHATLHWARLANLVEPLKAEADTPRNDIEERIAWAHGWMVKDIVSKLYKRKIYK